MNLKRYGALLMAVTLPLAMASPLVHAEGTAYSMDVTVDLSGEHKEISPYMAILHTIILQARMTGLQSRKKVIITGISTVIWMI